jgi:tetratricopeptide (TPR) repeat protein
MNRIIHHSIALIWFVCLTLSGQAADHYSGFADPGSGSTDSGSGQPGSLRDDSLLLAGLHSGILHSIFDLQFERADSLMDISSELFPEAPGNIYLRGYRQFLDVLIEGGRPGFEALLEENGQRIETLREAARSYPVSFSYLSTIHLQSSVLCAYHGENFRAARHYYYAYHYLRQSEEKNAGNPLNYRNRGLITLISGSVPEEYGWMLRVLGIRGDIAQGLGYLQEYYTATSGTDRLEACLLLRFALQTLDHGEKVVDEILKGAGNDPVHQVRDYRHPGNGDFGETGAETLYRYANALEDLGAGRSNDVVEELQDYLQAAGEKAFPYLDLLLGEAMLNALDTGALVPLESFINRYNGEHYRHYTWHKISWDYALIGKWDRYEATRQKVLQCGEPYLDADRQALSEAQDTLPLNIVLLKARLLFDGGDYRKALEQLEVPEELTARGERDSLPQIPLSNKRDSIEYRYRLARIYDRLGDTERAVRYYEQVLAEDTGTGWYFAPNSALHLGMIHEASGDTEKALAYYRECLKINKSAYKMSIDYKARQGVRRMEQKLELR